MVGLPVFAGPPVINGHNIFCWPNNGISTKFLIAFFFAGFFKYGNNHITNFLKLIFAVSIIYLLGMLWLVKFTGWEKVFMVGAQPFLLAELFKILILTALIPKIRKNK